jgi:hypothetical protein
LTDGQTRRIERDEEMERSRIQEDLPERDEEMRLGIMDVLDNRAPGCLGLEMDQDRKVIRNQCSRQERRGDTEEDVTRV